MPTLHEALKDKLAAGRAYLKNPNFYTERDRDEAIEESARVAEELALRWKRMSKWRFDTSKTPGINKWELKYSAWPGSYPIAYLTRGNDVLCPKCANAAINDTSDEPPIEGYVIQDPWDDAYCDNCNARFNEPEEQERTQV